MDLFLILFGIAALGILALVLIIWGRMKSQQNIATASLEKTTPPKLTPNNKKDLNVIKPHHKRIDPVLSSMGFGAIDDLFNEPKLYTNDPVINENVEKIKVDEEKKSKKISHELIIFYLLAPLEQPFAGYEILQALSANGFKFGEMSIFHFYNPNLDSSLSDELLNESQKSLPLFSVATAAEPGFFDLANLGGYFCPGLSMFMPLDNNARDVFELFVETSKQLAEDLTARLCDQDRKLLTQERIEEYREFIAKLVVKEGATN